MTLTARLRQAAIGWIYPPACAGCEVPLTSTRQIEMPFLCAGCEDALIPVSDGACPVCGQSYDAPVGLTVRCGNCGDREFDFDFALGAYRSSGGIREIMHACKYGKQLHLTRLFATLMQRVWEDERLRARSSWLVVPVPLHPRRFRSRGFNQAHEIAREFVRLAPDGLELELTPVLERTRHTVRQAQLDRTDRLGNLTGAFRLRRHASLDFSEETGILVLDDVMTTGATISECAAVLRDAGPDDPGPEPLIVGISALRG